MLTVREAARRLGISRQRVKQLIDVGRIYAVRKPDDGRRTLYIPEVYVRIVQQEHESPALPPPGYMTAEQIGTLYHLRTDYVRMLMREHNVKYVKIRGKRGNMTRCFPISVNVPALMLLPGRTNGKRKGKA